MQKISRFKERLITRRNRLSLTQEELAARASVSVRSISDYERGLGGSPTLEQLSKLAAALGVPVGWLIGEDEAPAMELKDAPMDATDPESVRLAFRIIKSQISAVADQVALYERQICGEPTSPAGDEAARKLLRLGAEEAKGEKNKHT